MNRKQTVNVGLFLGAGVVAAIFFLYDAFWPPYNERAYDVAVDALMVGGWLAIFWRTRSRPEAPADDRRGREDA